MANKELTHVKIIISGDFKIRVYNAVISGHFIERKKKSKMLITGGGGGQSEKKNLETVGQKQIISLYTLMEDRGFVWSIFNNIN